MTIDKWNGDRMDTQKEPIIEFKGVSKTFGDRNILDRIDFSIYEGEVTTLIGLSGTGKSVTLKHIPVRAKV
jgi:phospholipid/cholesterol/gamma-HCH transport system ATP-binding protein